jgi:hypothetical protein
MSAPVIRRRRTLRLPPLRYPVPLSFDRSTYDACNSLSDYLVLTRSIVYHQIDQYKYNHSKVFHAKVRLSLFPRQ